MLAEIANVGFALQETTRRGREDDLPSVRGRRDPRRAMDVDSDVAFVGHLRLPGVDAHANADLAAAERLAGGGRGRDRIGCSREGDEEGVALGVDLDAVVPGERSSQRGAVFGEEIGVPGAVFLKEPGRAFDVREEEGDGAGREICHPTNYCAAPWPCQASEARDRRNDPRPCRITPHMSSTLLDIGAAGLREVDAEALVAEAAAGREQGLAGLYDLYGRRAYGLALRVLRDETLAENAVQDAFLTVWRSAADYRPERGAPSTWILTIVHRRAVDIVRREKRRRVDLVEEFEEPAGDATEETVLARAEGARIRRALAQLAPAQRRLLELAYYGGFTQSEIAVELDLPLGTVKSLTFTALSRLRSLLEGGEGIVWTFGGPLWRRRRRSVTAGSSTRRRWSRRCGRATAMRSRRWSMPTAPG